MSYEIRFYPQVRSDKQSIDPPVWDRIVDAIQSKLSRKPEYFGKPLRGTLRDFWSLRVGDYRVGYVIEEDASEVHVVAVAHRQDVYERIERRFPK